LRASADALAQARHGASTRDSIRAAQAAIAAVRALASGTVNNMMLTAGPVDGLDAQSLATDFETLGSAAENAVPPADAQLPPPYGEPGREAAEAASLGQSAADAEQLSESAPGNPAARPAAAGAYGALSIPFSTAFDVVTDLTGHGELAAWRALRTLARAETAPLKAKLERALRADELTHWKREQERGEIDRPALARLATSPAYRTPFRVRRVTKGRDAAVSLLIDRSGSMAGQKIQLARLCAAALCDALTQLGFDCEVLGYSSIESADLQRIHADARAAGTDLRGYNRLVERLDLQIYKRFGATDLSGLAAIECGHENPDGEALAWAAGRLAEHRAERRILMVLSDGYPATGDGDPAILRDDLRQRAAAVQKTGIELLGVGILDDAVQSFYPRHIVVRKLNDLPSEAFAALGKMLLNR
jgi:cobalamin biosynthesis protein CobT